MEGQHWDPKTRGYTNTGHGWPRSSRPHVSKGVIDRVPDLKFDYGTGQHHDSEKNRTKQYWDPKSRGYTNTGHGWPRSSRPHVSKGVIDRVPDLKFDDGTGQHHDGSSKGEGQYWDHKTRGYTNTQRGWPHSSRPHVSKGVIDRVPDLKFDDGTGQHYDKDSKPSDSEYWDPKSRGYTNTGHGWPRSSRPHKSKGVIDREVELRR